MKDIYIGKGDLDGKGVYAGRDFEKGEVAIEYHLQPLTDEEWAKLPEEERQFVHIRQGRKWLYRYPEKYVNHSQNPNTVQDFTIGCDRAIRFICKGEMITTDATKEDF